MTTLRILVTAAPSAAQALQWALFESDGPRRETGNGRPDSWPAADRVEFVIPAAQARIACVKLPPLPSGRVAGAAAFAVEDQIAGPGDMQHLTTSAQRADGQVRVVIVARDLVSACGAFAVGGRRAARVIAEPDLVAPDAAWHWCASDASGRDGFLRIADGRALPAGAIGADGSLPAELVFALRQEQHAGRAPAEVRVDAPIADASLARWKAETGTAFVRGTPWRWHTAGAAAFAGALPLRQEGPAPQAASGRDRRRLFVPALAIAVAALALHVVLTLGEWGWQKYSAWQRGRDWIAVATSAGVAPAQAATSASAAAAIARRYMEQRHAHGKSTPDDALPLLARSSAALALLPPGTVRSAVYSDGHWTFDLGRVDAGEARELDSRMRAGGIPALVATSAAGTRVRVGTP
jgi:type II secretion system protein L